MSAIPTGSLAPDSPSRIVPVLPEISRPPSTENITAGSVGATAAPIRPAVTQPKPNAQCATTAIPPAVANVPTTPSATIVPLTLPKRRQPIEPPPSKRITISAIDATRSTVSAETENEGKRSEATAAATRKIAGAGIGIRSLTFDARSAAATAPETTRIPSPNVVRSSTGATVSSVQARPRRPAAENSLHFRHSRHTRWGNTLGAMRLVLMLLVLVLAAPAAAVAVEQSSGDGSLVVSSASVRTITVQGNGLVFGHFDQGVLT